MWGQGLSYRNVFYSWSWVTYGDVSLTKALENEGFGHEWHAFVTQRPPDSAVRARMTLIRYRTPWII